MKLIVISAANSVPNEHEIITSLFKEGLEAFHIHKPSLNKKEIEEFVQMIPEKYQSSVFMHSDFLKAHSLEELKTHSIPLGLDKFAFLSPVFDSISKKDYKSKFSDKMTKFSAIKPELINAIEGKNMIALGGIDEDKIDIVRKVGFSGVAVLGAIWNNKNPLEKFKKLNSLCTKNILAA